MSIKCKAFDKLSSVVAHELRNPLGTIKNSVYIVQHRINEQFIVDDIIDEAMGRISRNITRCDNIVQDLIDFSRSTALFLKKTNLYMLVDEVIYDIPHSNQIKIYNSISKTIYMNIDPEKIRRVFINLINNSKEAILDDYNGPGYGNIKITSTITTDWIIFNMYDNGSGISAQDLERIKEPLVSTKSFGIGLGLSIVEKIVIAHNGMLKITSKNNEYTNIKIYLPKSRLL